VGLLAFVAYVGALRAGFVWDDWFLVAENPRLEAFDRLPALFLEDYVHVPETNLAYGYYRPVASLSFVLDAALWGIRPFGFHLTNLLLHALASIWVALLATRLGLGRSAALACGALFAVHPIHVESVAWISGRTDLLAFVLACASLHTWLAAHDTPAAGARTRALRIASLFLFSLALLAKEMAAVLPLWLLCLHPGKRHTSRPTWRGRAALRDAAPYFGLLLLYLVLRFLVLDLPAPGQPPEYSLQRALATAAPTIAGYLARLTLPSDPSAYLQNPWAEGLLDLRNLGAVALLLLLAFAIRRLARYRPEALRLGAMLLLSFAPILNVPRIAGPADMGAPMADRFAYFPSFPFLALALLALETAVTAAARPIPARRLAGALLLLLVGSSTVATARRVEVWRDDETLFAFEVERTPDAPLLWTQLARARLRANDLDGAGRALDRAESLDPQGHSPLAARAEWHVRRGEPELAIPLQRRAVGDLETASPAARNNLAFLYRTSGRPDLALPILEALSREMPDYADPHLNLGETRRQLGDLEGSLVELERYVALRPDDLEGLDALARALTAAGRYDEGERLYNGALERSADDPRLWNNLALVRFEAGNLLAARAALERSLAISPDSPRARFNLAIVLRELGEWPEARERLTALAREAPHSPEGEAAREELAALGDASAGAFPLEPIGENGDR